MSNILNENMYEDNEKCANCRIPIKGSAFRADEFSGHGFIGNDSLCQDCVRKLEAKDREQGIRGREDESTVNEDKKFGIEDVQDEISQSRFKKKYSELSNAEKNIIKRIYAGGADKFMRWEEKHNNESKVNEAPDMNDVPLDPSDAANTPREPGIDPELEAPKQLTVDRMEQFMFDMAPGTKSISDEQKIEFCLDYLKDLLNDPRVYEQERTRIFKDWVNE